MATANTYFQTPWKLLVPNEPLGATINGVTYEGVADFIYLGTLISNDNSVEKEIQRRILPL